VGALKAKVAEKAAINEPVARAVLNDDEALVLMR